MGKWFDKVLVPDILSLKAVQAQPNEIRRVETVSETFPYPPAYYVFELGATYTEASPAIIENDLGTGFWVMFPSPFILSAGNPTVDADLAGITWINTTTGDRYISNSDLSWTAIATGASSTVETTTAYTQPSVDANVTINVTSSENFAIGQFIYVEAGGNYEIISKPSTTQLEILNTGDTGNALPATEILTGSLIVPSGRPGDFAGLTDPMTTAGDIIIRDAGNATTRLAIGTEGQVLTVTTGIPAWEDPTGGSGLTNPVALIYPSVFALTWSSGATMDNGAYNVFSVTVASTGTLAHSNIPAGANEAWFRLHLTWTSGAITFPASWTKGMSAPSDPGNYLIEGLTIDAGTSWIIKVTYL